MNKCNKCGYDYSGSGDSAHVCIPVNAQQRTWVGLTDEEKSELWEISRAAWPRYITYASLAEAKLKERNT